MKVLTLGPMLLSAQTAPMGAAVATGVSDVARLQNPARTPFLIDEIRFRISDPNATVTTQLALPYLVEVRLDIGKVPLTASRYIPIALLCRALDSSIELRTLPLGRNLNFPPFDNAVGGFVWRLPKPLYVPQGVTVVPSFRYAAGEFPGLGAGWGPTQVVIYVTMVGRALSSDTPPPKTVDLPVANCWTDTVRVGGADYVAIRSIRSDLKNPHAEPLFVQNMLGSYLYQDPSYNFYVPGGQSAYSDADTIGNDWIVARLFKSDGSAIVKAPAAWSHLFDWTTRSLQGNCGVLRHNEHYQIQTDIRLATMRPIVGGGGTGNSGDKVKLMASMIGYRRCAYSRGVIQEAG